MSRGSWIGLVLLVALTCAACGKKDDKTVAPQTGGSQDVAAPAPDPETPPAAGDELAQAPERPERPSGSQTKPGGQTPPAPAERPRPLAPTPKRDSVAGRWILSLTQQGSDIAIWLVEVGKPAAADEMPQVKLLASNPTLQETPFATATLKTGEVEGNKLHLVFDLQGNELDYQGTFTEGVVLGNLVMGEAQPTPARLVATDATSLEDHAEPQPTAGRDEFVEALRDDESYEAFEEFAEEYPNSPLSINAYGQMLASARERQMDAAAVEKLIDTYVEAAGRWGDRMVNMVRINSGLQLANQQYLPEVSLKNFDEAEQSLTDENREQWLPFIEMGRQAAQKVIARKEAQQSIEQLASEDAQEREEAEEALREYRGTYPFDPVVTYALARHAEAQEDVDRAIRLYGELTVLPFMERMLQAEWETAGEATAERALPSETMAKLWEQKHGNTDGLDVYLEEVYAESIHAFAPEMPEPTTPREMGRTALVELFTGIQCPPCVAADVAVGALADTFQHSDLIALQYHQHVPGPDPLTNTDAEERFAYYQGQGTPTLVVNGKTAPFNVGGPLDAAPDIYRRLMELVTPALEEGNEIDIQLAASAEGGKLEIAADVTGVEAGENLRLRLAIAEEHVMLVGNNAVRHHEMVVRAMPGGAAGVKPKEGKLAFKETIDLEAFRQDLVDYLDEYEEGVGFQFPSRGLSLETLHLVAFIQNDETQEILEAATIPVSGMLDFGQEEATEPKPETADDKPEATEKPEATDKPEAVKEEPADAIEKPDADGDEK